MKRLLTFLLLLPVLTALSQQTFTSSDNTVADWNDFIWTKSQGWMQNRPSNNNGSTPPGFGYWHVANVYGYVTQNGDMAVNNGGTLNVYDTLRITGNLTASQNITVHTEGILIVEGNMESSGGGVSNIAGTMIVLGDLTNRNGGDVNVTGDFYLLGSLSSPGSGEAYNGSGTPPSDYFQDEDDLETNPSLYAFAYGGTLPVKYSNLELKTTENGVSILWRTSAEINNDYFTVERSIDGVYYTAVGRVGGHGTTDVIQYYQFNDPNPHNGTSYYRLKQTDLDGTYSNSEVLRYVHQQTAGISFYPNPAVDIINLNIKGADSFTVKLMDLSGAVKKQLNGDVAGMENPSIQVSDLKRGLYMMEIILDGTPTIQKVLLN